MDADQVNKQVREALLEAGFKGTLPVTIGRRIINQVLADLNIQSHVVTVEMQPIHNVGKPITSNCNLAVIKVEPKRAPHRI